MDTSLCKSKTVLNLKFLFKAKNKVVTISEREFLKNFYETW